MFDKKVTNHYVSPCPVSGLIAVKDLKGKTHMVQRELISHTEEDEKGWYFSDGKTPTTVVHLIDKKWFRVVLTAEELAKRLKVEISE
ncbi:cobalamin biosynthesis protein CbiX [Salmonella enterica]|nr:cobalamin biosynthesis protein CbiX [Salmonella enterica]